MASICFVTDLYNSSLNDPFIDNEITLRQSNAFFSCFKSVLEMPSAASIKKLIIECHLKDGMLTHKLVLHFKPSPHF